MEIQQLKKKFFPEVNDWKNDYSSIKERKDWWTLKNKEFIMFHPIPFKIFNFLSPLFLVTLFVFLAYKSYILSPENWFWYSGFLFMAVLFLYRFSNYIIYERKLNFSFYDKYLREYD